MFYVKSSSDRLNFQAFFAEKTKDIDWCNSMYSLEVDVKYHDGFTESFYLHLLNK